MGNTEEEVVKYAQDGINLYMNSILEWDDPLLTGFGVITEPADTTPLHALHVRSPRPSYSLGPQGQYVIR